MRGERVAVAFEADDVFEESVEFDGDAGCTRDRYGCHR